ncbi:MAG: hypothetical protein QOE06_1739 [Thermoleophilaceae bacterium]|nr:hypothetical protein [Thermoleophilaceae bacterium]
MSCAELRSLIGGYVLHALEPGEEETVRRHLATCPDCAREHEELAPVPALLDAVLDPDAAPAEPPAGLEDAVLDRFARDQGPRARRRERRRGREPARRLRAPAWLARPLPAAALAAVAAVAVTLGLTGALGGGGSGAQKSYGAHLRAVAGGAPGQGSVPAPADRPYAYARLSHSPSGTRVQLTATGLAAPGSVYELWCVYPDGSKVSAGTFRAGPGGRAEVSMTTAARVGEYHRLSVEARSPGHPGRRILAGDIAY